MTTKPDNVCPCCGAPAGDSHALCLELIAATAGVRCGEGPARDRLDEMRAECGADEVTF